MLHEMHQHGQCNAVTTCMWKQMRICGRGGIAFNLILRNGNKFRHAYHTPHPASQPGPGAGDHCVRGMMFLGAAIYLVGVVI